MTRYRVFSVEVNKSKQISKQIVDSFLKTFREITFCIEMKNQLFHTENGITIFFQKCAQYSKQTVDKFLKYDRRRHEITFWIEMKSFQSKK